MRATEDPGTSCPSVLLQASIPLLAVLSKSTTPPPAPAPTQAAALRCARRWRASCTGWPRQAWCARRRRWLPGGTGCWRASSARCHTCRRRGAGRRWAACGGAPAGACCSCGRAMGAGIGHAGIRPGVTPAGARERAAGGLRVRWPHGLDHGNGGVGQAWGGTGLLGRARALERCVPFLCTCTCT